MYSRYLAITDRKKEWKYIGVIIWYVIGTVLGVTSGVILVLDIFKVLPETQI